MEHSLLYFNQRVQPCLFRFCQPFARSSASSSTEIFFPYIFRTPLTPLKLPMYPHYHHQPLDANNNAASGSMYQQQRPPPPPAQQFHHPIAYHPTVPSQSSSAAASRHPPPPAFQQAPPPPAEPLPSASDVQQTLALSIPQMAEFASSMVYLMWHARRPSVMALHSASKVEGGTGAATEQDADQSRETANIASSTSSAFKKFSRQVLIVTGKQVGVIIKHMIS